MRDRRSTQLIACVAALGTAVLSFVAVTDFPPTIDRTFHQSVGQAIALETLSRWKPGGTITAILRDTAEFKHPEADAQFAGFRSAIQKAGGTVDTVLTLQVDPLRPIAVPPGDFFELIRKGSSGSVLVSFMGPPELTSEQRAQLTDIKPTIVAFCPGRVADRARLRDLFDNGLLHLAIVDRTPAPTPTAAHAGKSPKNSRPLTFEETYRILRPADAASLADPERDPG